MYSHSLQHPLAGVDEPLRENSGITEFRDIYYDPFMSSGEAIEHKFSLGADGYQRLLEVESINARNGGYAVKSECESRGIRPRQRLV